MHRVLVPLDEELVLNGEDRAQGPISISVSVLVNSSPSGHIHLSQHFVLVIPVVPVVPVVTTPFHSFQHPYSYEPHATT
jgi:hypothetical protein